MRCKLLLGHCCFFIFCEESMLNLFLSFFELGYWILKTMQERRIRWIDSFLGGLFCRRV
jgi:hypothetical protein